MFGLVYSSTLFVEPISYQLKLFMQVEERGKIRHPVVKKLFNDHIIPKNIVGS